MMFRDVVMFPEGHQITAYSDAMRLQGDDFHIEPPAFIAAVVPNRLEEPFPSRLKQLVSLFGVPGFNMTFKSIVNLFRFPRQTRLRHSQSIAYLAQKIPAEILDAIFTFLSIPDQICLALSFKRFHLHYLSLLEVKGKTLYQLVPREGRQLLCPHNSSKRRPRVQLLHQLENIRWKFYIECWSLHLASAWKRPGDRDLPVRILHLSFRDFLTHSRSKVFVDEPRTHKEIAESCLKTMRSHLRKDLLPKKPWNA